VRNASPGCKFLGELFSYFIIGEFLTAACIYLIQGFPSFLNNAAENQTTIPALSPFLSHAGRTSDYQIPGFLPLLKKCTRQSDDKSGLSLL
jgi:hypothetical protein